MVEDCIFGISFLDVYLSKIHFQSTNDLNDSYSCDLLKFPAGILLQIASLFQTEKNVSYFDKLRKVAARSIIHLNCSAVGEVGISNTLLFRVAAKALALSRSHD